jgi:hypothetical protein
LAPWSGLPFADGRFNIVLSTFAAMFTPDDDRTAEPYLVELSGPQAADIQCTRRTFNFRYHSAAHWIEVFRTYYGPTHKAFAALDGEGQARLHADLLQLLESRNVAGPNSLVIPGEYLEAVITR